METALNTSDLQVLNERIHERSAFVDLLALETGKKIVGQKYMMERLLLGLLAGGHILLEGVPGLAKTLAIKSLSSAIDARFSRIQFDHEFSVKKGPIFANFILADEINRAPAKVQSALLEAMQERQVTIGDQTFLLQEPFLVLATQNPIEQEGTYPLPEAQVDRFMLKVVISYPAREEERLIMRQNTGEAREGIQAVVSPQAILEARELVRQVYMDEKIEQYILDLVIATRKPGEYQLQKLEPLLAYGGSPRASINLALASKAYAFIKRRGYVIPEDVRAVCADVLRHRIGLTYEAEAEDISAEDVIADILNKVEVP
jgi:MoxR-like ATPase